MSYPPQHNQPYYQPSETSTWAIISLIAGIAGWLGLFGLGGLVAVICGYAAKNQISGGGGRFTGSGMATAGLILGWINIAFGVIGCCLTVLIMTGSIAAPVICLPFMEGLNIQP